MLIIYVDADACPVKSEIYKVARRYALRVLVVANAPLRVPNDPLLELVVQTGFGAADDWIAEQAGVGDVVVTADIPLAAEVVGRGAHALDPRGVLYTAENIPERLAVRNLMAELRSSGVPTGGPAAWSPGDTRAFANQLDWLLSARKARRE